MIGAYTSIACGYSSPYISLDDEENWVEVSLQNLANQNEEVGRGFVEVQTSIEMALPSPVNTRSSLEGGVAELPLTLRVGVSLDILNLLIEGSPDRFYSKCVLRGYFPTAFQSILRESLVSILLSQDSKEMQGQQPILEKPFHEIFSSLLSSESGIQGYIPQQIDAFLLNLSWKDCVLQNEDYTFLKNLIHEWKKAIEFLSKDTRKRSQPQMQDKRISLDSIVRIMTIRMEIMERVVNQRTAFPLRDIIKESFLVVRVFENLHIRAYGQGESINWERSIQHLLDAALRKSEQENSMGVIEALEVLLSYGLVDANWCMMFLKHKLEKF